MAFLFDFKQKILTFFMNLNIILILLRELLTII